MAEHEFPAGTPDYIRTLDLRTQERHEEHAVALARLGDRTAILEADLTDTMRRLVIVEQTLSVTEKIALWTGRLVSGVAAAAGLAWAVIYWFAKHVIIDPTTKPPHP